MIQRANLDAERVLITGASGGSGFAAVQLAKRGGAHVSAVTSVSKAADLKALFADTTFDRNDPLPDDLFNVVLDLVGGQHWHSLLEALAVRGCYVTSSVIAGPIVELDLHSFCLKDLTLLESTRQDSGVFSDLIAYMKAREIRAVVSQGFELRELAQAQKAFTQ